MKLKDNIDLKGYFSLEIFNKDGSTEKYEDKNLIMDSARNNMAELVGGYAGGNVINKIKLGNKGHNNNDILDYKQVDENGEFVSSRTSLFAEDPLYDAEGGFDSLVYGISFDVESNNLIEVDSAAVGSFEGSVDTHVCEVSRTISDRVCTFVITIPDYAANKEGGAIAYTEAAFYAGDRIFSMKTFPARVKEDTVKFVITWSIIF